MPFHNAASKLVLITALLLIHHALLARSAPPGPVPVNPNTATSGVGNASTENALLDARLLPFLASCNGDKIAEKLCEQYRFLATTVLTQPKPEPVTLDVIQKAMNEEVDANNFCDNLSPVVKNRKAKHPDMADNPLGKEVVCSVWCAVMNENDDMTMEIKPICKVLLWGYRRELASEQEMAPQDPAKKAAALVVPPLLPENVKLPEVAKNEELPVDSKPLEPVAPQPNITESEKSVPKPADSQSNVAADTKESGPDTAAAAAAAKASPDAAVAEKSPATIGKGATTAASNIQQKATPTADKDTPDEEDAQADPNEALNQEHILSEINNDESIGGNLDPNEYDDDFEQSDRPQEASVNEKQQHQDSDGVFSVEKPAAAAAAAVTIERVDPFFDQDDSNFFSYFLFMMFACIVCYVAYHNKSKLLALLVEGRRSSSGRGGFSKGRKHTAAYRKLDSNLEEAITSSATAASSRSTSQIIY